MNIKIGNRFVGNGYPCFVVVDIGINHNGDLGIAKKLIDAARIAGCDAVKFQIRDVDKLFTKEQLAAPKESPWGSTYEQYVRGREFDADEMSMLVYHTMQPNNEILWGASYWACEPSEEYPLPDFIKIQSSAIRDLEHIKRMSEYKVPVILSTGGATIEQISDAVETITKITNQYAVLQCNSTYPSEYSEMDLRVMETYIRQFGCVIGLSSHERGTAVSTCAAAMGAKIVERHITLDRTMWGTDHSASLEPQGVTKLVRDIHNIEMALGKWKKRVYPGEITKIKSLGKVKK